MEVEQHRRVVVVHPHTFADEGSVSVTEKLLATARLARTVHASVLASSC